MLTEYSPESLPSSIHFYVGGSTGLPRGPTGLPHGKPDDRGWDMSSLVDLGHPELARGFPVPLSPRASLRRWLVWAIGLLFVAALVGGLVLHGDARTLVVDGLGLLAVWMSSWVCWLAVWRVGFRYWEVLVSAAAVVAQAAGLTYLGVVVAGGGSVPLPSPADVGFLLFYPLMLTALVVAVLHHSWGLASSVWLDCAVGSLGAASVLAVVPSLVQDTAHARTQSL